MAAKAHNTIGTVLKFGTSANSLTELCKIKTFPQLNGEREQIETTDLTDEAQTFVPGVQSVESMTFSANFTIATYNALKANALTDGFFELDFGGNAGAKATWEGQYDVYVNEGEVNGLIEQTIVVYPSTVVTIAASSATT
jgi:hypothetical protein